MPKLSSDMLYHTSFYHVKGWMADRYRQIKIPNLVQLMHETAMEHVLKLHISARELGPRGLGWALHQQHIEFFRLPKLGDKFKVVTHPSGVEKLLTHRDYHMYDEEDQVVAQASTTWFMMDIRKRRIARYPEDILAIILQGNELDALPRQPKLPKIVVPQEGVDTFKVRYHDLDFNDHLNNNVYVRWLLDSIHEDWWQTHRLRSLQMKFLEEGKWGESVDVRMSEGEAEWQMFQLAKNGRAMAEGRLMWDKEM
ncbi:MAG: acyl-ACP thioesterase domain-containing protein [Bacteroidota bacterium]